MTKYAPAIRSTCPYCGVGCGVIAARNEEGDIEVKGDRDHPANFGRLCSKGSALAETLGPDDRLLAPLVHGKKASWSTALDLVAKKFTEAIDEYGPESVAFYVSGQCLTEDYYVANKLMKGLIGSANIDTNSRLCMASSVAGHRRAFGTDTVPGTYDDLELADLVILVGSNLAWCHPVLFQRLAAAREKRGTKVVLIDPRETASVEIADMHLALAPGSDVALFSGLLSHLAAVGRIDLNYVEQYTSGFDAALAAAIPTADAAKLTGIDAQTLSRFYELFTSNPRVVTVYSQGVNQSSAGTDKVNAIINCHLATGRIGHPGMGPFSITGQPNAMGGREVGGLANMLAAHMDLDNGGHRDIVAKFWGVPRVVKRPGLKAVDLFQAAGDGRIKALWIMATNPVDSLPEADGVRAALKACPFVVVSDVIRHTDTTACAHVLLPSAAWGEKDGTVTNSERVISRQRAFMPAPGMARPDWWQIVQVARRMGYSEAFPFESPAEIFAEHAALSAASNDGTRDFDIGAHAAIDAQAYDELAPFQWPQPEGRSPGISRFFANGGFFTPDRRGRFIPTSWRAPASATSAEFPLVLNTGRIRDQWHTMTRTARSARLMGHSSEPFGEIHPFDAAAAGVRDGDLTTISSASGTVIVRAMVTGRQQRGSVFVPMHWTDRYSSKGRIDALVAANTDPVSGQPELKFSAVSIAPFQAAWQGFAVSVARPALGGLDYWALATAKAGYRLDLAGLKEPDDWTSFACGLLAIGEDGELLSYRDAHAGQYRFAVFDGEQLAAALFVARTPIAVSRSWVTEQLGQFISDPAARLRLLAGRACAGAGSKDRGAIVCACFEVGVNDIVAAVKAGGCTTVDAVGAAVRAGTNCGSCRAEISRIIDDSGSAAPGLVRPLAS